MAQAFNLQIYKETHDLATMVEQITGEAVRPGRNIRCPFHDDRNPSMTIFEDGRFKCWGCDRHGDLFDFLGLVWFGDNYALKDVIDRLGEVAPKLPAPAPRKPSVRPTLNPALVDRFERNLGERELGYWRRQGITPHALYSLRIGWTGERYAFPWFYRGVLTAFKLRRDDERSPTLEPKYISVKGSRFAAPYNIDAVTFRDIETVLIVEDEKSVLAAARYHYPAIAAPANQWKPEWSMMLSNVGRIVIVADGDEPGRASAEKIKTTLPRARAIEAPEGKDLFDFHTYLLDRIEDWPLMCQLMKEWIGI